MLTYSAQLACSILPTTYKPLFRALYKAAPVSNAELKNRILGNQNDGIGSFSAALTSNSDVFGAKTRKTYGAAAAHNPERKRQLDSVVAVFRLDWKIKGTILSPREPDKKEKRAGRPPAPLFTPCLK